jgi:hypothetical protein
MRIGYKDRRDMPPEPRSCNLKVSCNEDDVVFREDIADKNDMKVTFIHEGKEIGFIRFKLGKQCYIEIMRFEIECQNKGFGSCIYPVIEKLYFKSCQGISLLADTEDSVRFWHRQGFILDYYDKEDDGYRMSKGDT